MSSKSSTSVSRRSFLRSGATAAALAAAGAAFGCAPSGSESLSATGEKADVADLNEHVVESDTAILEGRGRWQGAPCPKGCSLTCSPCQYVVDNVPVRGKVVDYFEEDDCNRQLRSCHAYKVDIQPQPHQVSHEAQGMAAWRRREFERPDAWQRRMGAHQLG